MGAWSSASRSHVAHMRAAISTAASSRRGRRRHGHLCASSTPMPRARRPCSRQSVPVEAGDVVAAAAMSRRELQSLLRARDCRGTRRHGPAAVAAPQGDDDEGVRPDHVRPRGARVLPRRLRASTRRCSRALGVDPDNGIGDVYSKIAIAAGGQRRPPSRADIAGRVHDAGRRWRWSTRARASPTCTCRATSSSTPRCRRRFAPRVRCGGRTASCTTRRR